MCRDNEPYIVTLSYGYDAKAHALYFHVAVCGLKLEFIKQNPSVSGTVIEDLGYKKTQCEQKYRSVVFRGKMYEVDGLAEKKHGLNILLNHLEDDIEPRDVDPAIRGIESVWGLTIMLAPKLADSS